MAPLLVIIPLSTVKTLSTGGQLQVQHGPAGPASSSAAVGATSTARADASRTTASAAVAAAVAASCKAGDASATYLETNLRPLRSM